MTLDPNPYWMGFYASRPEAKRRANRIVRKLVIAEKLTVLPARAVTAAAAGAPDETEIARDLRKAWDLTVMSNHHDFITGTSPDRIWRAEQQPWLEQAEGLADDALARIRAIRPAAADAPAAAATALAPRRGKAGGGHRRVPRRAGRAAGRRHHQLPPGRLGRGVARRTRPTIW